MTTARTRSSTATVFAVAAALGGCKTSNSLTAASSSAGSGSQDRSLAIEQQVEAALSTSHAKSRGTTWFKTGFSTPTDWVVNTTDKLWGQPVSALPKQATCKLGTQGCDSDFTRLVCSTDADCGDAALHCLPLQATVSHPGDNPRNLCQYPSDTLIDRMYQAIVVAHSTVDITSLSAPQGVFNTAMVNALTYLSLSNQSTKVRLLYAGVQTVTLNIINPPSQYLKTLIAELTAHNANLSALQINAGWLSSPQPSWNHAKMIITDQSQVLAGGHNWWDPDYVGTSPVSDLSIIAQGSGVIAMEQYADTLWSFIQFNPLLPTYMPWAAYPAGQRLAPFADKDLPAKASDETLALVMGRLGYYGDNASDDGLRAFIDAAQQELLISQQDIFNLTAGPTGYSFALKNLVNAVLRGVNVSIIQSNSTGDPLNGYGTVEAKIAWAALYGRISAAAAASNFSPPDGGTVRDFICGHVNYTTNRYSHDWASWPLGGAEGNHVKLMIADRSAFTLGSQNLYPANLMEITFGMFDQKLTADLINKYWTPAWSGAVAGQLPCPG